MSSLRRTLAALALAVLLPLPALAGGQHVVKSGETLSEIAEKYGVSLQRLMQLNDIKDPKLVQTGARLKLPDGSTPARGSVSGGGGKAGNYTVKAGETLSEIADRHGVTVQRLMQLNGLKDANLVQAGTRLVVPGAAAAAAKPAAKPDARPAAAVDRNASEHVVKPGETLSGIAESYDIPVSRLISLNDLKEPNLVKIGTRLRLRGDAAARPAADSPEEATATPKPKPTQPSPAAAKPASPSAAAKPTTATAKAPAAAPKAAAAQSKPVTGGTSDWRTYGPLQIDFANWRPMAGSQVAPALNSAGQPLFLAVNCEASKLNTTGQGGTWKTWEPPQSDFEQQVVKDVCTTPVR